MLTMLYCSIR